MDLGLQPSSAAPGEAIAGDFREHQILLGQIGITLPALRAGWKDEREYV